MADAIVAGLNDNKEAFTKSTPALAAALSTIMTDDQIAIVIGANIDPRYGSMIIDNLIKRMADAFRDAEYA